ncbi:MAG TPA: sigma-70 family RNA polymerase sigma factor [Chthonomonas sp.]|uniref:RNA polymerase sigma factor n=1 Tax=Chthonomonas sp. TaxID=2282153 RepID=UPI002B4B4C33|nr:sigma-70 family RNA polymerase sigma factor [Chthonomonas sp.]HLI48428.1 sigma-70 family RNA polymerase sigma factor [Chthonomonas sp.]
MKNDKPLQPDLARKASMVHDAKTILYEQLIKIGFTEARRVGVPSTHREDCALEFAAHVWSKLSEERYDNLPYLYRAAHNFACNYRRHLLNYTCLPQRACSDQEPVLEPEFHRVELRYMIEQALLCLTPIQRLIVLRRYYEQDSIKQISTDLGMAPNTVSMQLLRAKAKLRKALVIEETAPAIESDRTQKSHARRVRGGRMPSTIGRLLPILPHNATLGAKIDVTFLPCRGVILVSTIVARMRTQTPV